MKLAIWNVNWHPRESKRIRKIDVSSYKSMRCMKRSSIRTQLDV